MTDINVQIPGGELNNARYQLDTAIIPKIFHKDPSDFVIRCLRAKDGYLCALFNRYYDFVNPVFFIDSYKHFEVSDFSQTEHSFDGNKRILYIHLPTEHQGSLNYCTAYVFAYEKKFFGPKNAKFYTIEHQFGGGEHIGSVDKEGNHVDFGASSGTKEGDIARIQEMAFQEEKK